MYTVRIMSGSIKEINNVEKALGLDLWKGAPAVNKKHAEMLAKSAYAIEPKVEIKIELSCYKEHWEELDRIMIQNHELA